MMKKLVRQLSNGKTSGGMESTTSPSSSSVKSQKMSDDYSNSILLGYTLTNFREGNSVTLLLIHGIDSSRRTWTSVQRDLNDKKIPTISIDLRGFGTSDLGSPEEFSIENISKDIYLTLMKTGVLSSEDDSTSSSSSGLKKKVFVLGHSMGSRAALRFVSDYPEKVQGFIMEDMDLRDRMMDPSDTTEAWMKKIKEFNREIIGSELDSVVQYMKPYGYTKDQIEDWVKYERIRQGGDKKTWWSDVNPYANWLAMHRVLTGDSGILRMKKISSLGMFPIFVFVARGSRGTACDDLETMKKSCPKLRVEIFKDAGHSIHNTNREEFIDRLVEAWNTN